MNSSEATPASGTSDATTREEPRGFDRAVAPDSFRVMSFNVAADLAPVGKVIAAIRKENPDVVGLQELGDKLAEAIHQELHDLFPYWILHPGGYEGKGLLSRFPLSEIDHLHVSPGRPDLVATFAFGTDPVIVLVAHPKPPSINLSGVSFDPVTSLQIDMIAEAALAGGPALILGDFNMTPRHRNYARFTAAGLIDAFHESGGSGATLPARVGNTSKVGERWRQVKLRPVLRVDYIWYTKHLRAAESWVGQDGGSDHMPVLAEMTWREVDGE